jgi:hypothetical protein
MKIHFQYPSPVALFVLVLIFMCLGCTGFAKEYQNFKVAIKETRSAIRGNLNLDQPKPVVQQVSDSRSGDSNQNLQSCSHDMPKDFHQHTVHWPGESLSLIAKWYTGAHQNWKRLAKANPSIEPRLIKPGDTIRIPSTLLKTRKPLPQNIAARYTPHYFAHIVKYDGEKIEDIAGWYTGNTKNWEKLAQANPNLNAKRLMTGNEIYIPQYILKTRKPFPLPQPSSSASKIDSRPISAEPKKVPTLEEKIKLFGPKQVPSS